MQKVITVIRQFLKKHCHGEEAKKCIKMQIQEENMAIEVEEQDVVLELMHNEVM